MVDCVKSFVRGRVKRRRNNALEKLIEGGNGGDVINYGMVIVGRKTLVEFRLAEIVGNIDACFQK
jgi:hypothetical protein